MNENPIDFKSMALAFFIVFGSCLVFLGAMVGVVKLDEMTTTMKGQKYHDQNP